MAHRIIEKSGIDYITRGDNNNFDDPAINLDNILCAIPQVPRKEIIKNAIS